MKAWEPGAKRDWIELAVILGLACGSGWLVMEAWPAVKTFAAENPLASLLLVVVPLVVFGIAAAWVERVLHPRDDIYSAQDTRRPWEEVE